MPIKRHICRMYGDPTQKEFGLTLTSGPDHGNTDLNDDVTVPVAVVNLSLDAVDGMLDKAAKMQRRAMLGCAPGYARESARRVLEAALGRLPKRRATPLPRIALGDTVRLKWGTSAIAKVTCDKVMFGNRRAPGGVRLSRPLNGLRYWNASDLVRVKRGTRPTHS